MPDEIQEETAPQEVPTEAPQTEEPTAEAPPVESPQTEVREEPRTKARDLQEMRDRYRSLEQQFKAYREGHLAQYPNAAGQNLNQHQPVFDSDTDANIRKVIEPERGQISKEIQDLRAQVLKADLQREYEDFEDLYPDFQDKFAALANEGFGGKETAKVIFNAIRAEKGIYTDKGRQEAERHQKERAAASAPKGGAPAKTEQRSFADMTLEEREQYREKVKAGLV